MIGSELFQLYNIRSLFSACDRGFMLRSMLLVASFIGEGGLLFSSGFCYS